jgi:hypothetical protein
MDGMFHMHPPKTAGTSIIRALIDNTSFAEKYGEIYKSRINIHATPAWYNSKENYFHHKIENDSFVTLAVREPYDRIISFCDWYSVGNDEPYSLDNHMSQIKRIRKMSLGDLLASPSPSLGDLLSVQSTMNFRLATSYTYSDWEDSVTNKVKIIRFESVEQNFQTIYPGLQLPHIHKKDILSRRFSKCRKIFHSQEILDKFNNHYESDFERYNYTMHSHLDDLLQKYTENR